MPPGPSTQGAALPQSCQLHTPILAQPCLSPSLECVARAPSSLLVKEAGWVVPQEGNESSQTGWRWGRFAKMHTDEILESHVLVKM